MNDRSHFGELRTTLAFLMGITMFSEKSCLRAYLVQSGELSRKSYLQRSTLNFPGSSFAVLHRRSFRNDQRLSIEGSCPSYNY